MLILFMRAYLELVRFDLLLAGRDFEAIHREVRELPIAHRTPSPQALERICSAIERASICYRKEVLCLQRSAATVCLLKAHGIPARMILGARLLPFKAHAWVEVEGRVLNERPYAPEIYAILDRC
jgi:hypothetical protein